MGLDLENISQFFIDTGGMVFTGMHQSALEGNSEDIQYYLDYLCHDNNPKSRSKLESNSESKSWITPLHLAAKHGNLEVIQLFHENLPDISIVDSKGWNSLHFAADGGYLESVEFLVDFIPKYNPIQYFSEELFQKNSRSAIKFLSWTHELTEISLP